MKNRYFVAALILVTLLLAIPSAGQAWRGHHGHGRGWYGPGVFLGGVLLGTAIAPPRYYYPPVYVYPPPPVVYAPPPAYAYPDPAYPADVAAGQPSSEQARAGQWIEVPGQMVNGTWVPSHKAWVPDSQ